MKERLNVIGKAEKCPFDDEQIDYILEIAEGDMRRAVTTLQSAHALSAAGPVSKADLCELAGLPPSNVVDNIWSNLTSYANMQEAVENVCAEGFSAQALLVALSRKTLEEGALNDLSKAKLAICIAEAEKNLIDGADEYLQLMTVCGLALTCMEESNVSKRE
jgi:replication factor C subunit 2/4